MCACTLNHCCSPIYVQFEDMFSSGEQLCALLPALKFAKMCILTLGGGVAPKALAGQFIALCCKVVCLLLWTKMSGRVYPSACFLRVRDGLSFVSILQHETMLLLQCIAFYCPGVLCVRMCVCVVFIGVCVVCV